MLTNLARPVENKYKISQVFGANPRKYKAMGFKGHMGIDFACPEGTPVKSAFWGEIIDIGWSNSGYGAYVKIQTDKYIFLYGHLSSIKVVRGCLATRGQIIGRSGNTGNSTGPHLHFEIKDPKKHNNGFRGRIDPFLFLNNSSKKCDEKIKDIQAEINQIKKDQYSKDSMYIHTQYIDRILKYK